MNFQTFERQWNGKIKILETNIFATFLDEFSFGPHTKDVENDETVPSPYDLPGGNYKFFKDAPKQNFALNFHETAKTLDVKHTGMQDTCYDKELIDP